MAKIVFIMDTEEGHIIPSFGVADSLKNRGHDIVYLSVLDNEELVKEQGFDFLPIFEKIFYKGYRKRYKNLAPPPGEASFTERVLQSEFNAHIEELMNGAYDSFLKELHADLFIVSTFLRTDILILYYKYNIRPVIFTPFLQLEGRTTALDYLQYLGNITPEEIYSFVEFVLSQGIKATTITQLVEPLNTLCEIVVCPYELEINNYPRHKNVYHIGPSIRKDTDDQKLIDSFNIPQTSRVIYASMGSQPIRYGKACDLFIDKLINVMEEKELQDCHLVLAVGPGVDIDKLHPIPDNVSIARWVPQIGILKRASVAIIHGGMGSVKECIYYGVPMLIFPMGYDQPWNADRVRHHNLGLTGDITTITEEEIKLSVVRLLEEDNIRQGIRKMQQVFREKEEADLAVPLIECLLAGKKPEMSIA